jgi:hypothetical protein
MHASDADDRRDQPSALLTRKARVIWRLDRGCRVPAVGLAQVMGVYAAALAGSPAEAAGHRAPVAATRWRSRQGRDDDPGRIRTRRCGSRPSPQCVGRPCLARKAARPMQADSLADLRKIDPRLPHSRDHPLGLDDTPPIIQHRCFGMADSFFDRMNLTAMTSGYIGNEALVNGVRYPEARTSCGWIRLPPVRRFQCPCYLFEASDGRSLFVIGSVCGLLESPVEMNQIMIYAGERFEGVGRMPLRRAVRPRRRPPANRPCGCRRSPDLCGFSRSGLTAPPSPVYRPLLSWSCRRFPQRFRPSARSWL